MVYLERLEPHFYACFFHTPTCFYRTTMSISISQHTEQFATAPQISPQDMAAISAHGFHTVINNRPDGEGGSEQPSSAAMAQAAQAAGLAYHYLPVISGQITHEQVQQFAALLKAAPGPVLAFCRSGVRSTNIWSMALAE